MDKLLKETIPGAASDSSARDPPPRCHPGTRLAILDRCLYFIAHCSGEKKMRWVVGAAGVGKSAIMQNVTESPKLQVTCHVSVFFSINGRNDGTKAIITLSYQLAAKFAPYRQLIEPEIARDPSLLRSSMSVQFNKFIIEPFIHKPQTLNSAERILIIIDGLDECNKRDTQLELLRLISDFCITYPSSPLVWLIASRPERHITSFFTAANVMPVYEKEEIPVDSGEGRADVERFLREKLKQIKISSDSFDLHSEWPEERHLWKLASVSDGLFAYAHTVVGYIEDSNIGNPASQLSDVLNMIDNLPMTGIRREDHPMARLDVLYAWILSKVPDRVMVHARKLILALASDWDGALIMDEGSFVVLCNWLAMTPNEAYAALNLLHSVMQIPRRCTAHHEKLQPFHKSFIDYVSDSSRSDFFTNMDHEAQNLKTECAFRILQKAPDGVDCGDISYEFRYGTVARGPGTGDDISLTWPIEDEEAGWEIDKTECMSKDNSRRREFMKHGILKKMPLEAVDIPTISRLVALQFRHLPSTMAHKTVGVSTILNSLKLSFHRLERTNLPDPWKSSCNHIRAGVWGAGKDQDWKTDFEMDGLLRCTFCYERFERQLRNWKTHTPQYTAVVLFTFTGNCCVEFRFIDPNDGISEWTYWFWCYLEWEERKKYGSTV
ncbi:hypothetical protein AGABI2DRAFT_147031 [Agaricus bisporus var. bisporus H97]|uniref:hypothetical protein n=1 Tax=Agaricus bisporus var. bisporus (strain H97 / ATCC MYA-4626 / FGSC 10389) TaxID=936046 RepID=UPI00029F67DF|nr:hypothetical protein AGABI2DRAFT_147031 [Agaricus bisporus var. bisporus H97]EKV41896.1 hypothetical protein AGABI2DRAFT_147031 [Agaricus bisporus var. bisporus H97]